MKLPAKWEVTVASKYAEGCSDEEVCKALKMSMTMYKRLYGSDPNFREAVDNGRGVAKAWWLEMGRVNLNNKAFNYTGWFQNMKNRYGWADKSEVADTISKPVESLSDEDLQRDVEALLSKMAGAK